MPKKRRVQKGRWVQYQKRLNRVRINPKAAGVTFIHIVEEAAQSEGYRPMAIMARELIRRSDWPPSGSFEIHAFSDINVIYGKPRDKSWQGALNAAWSKTIQLIRKDRVSRHKYAPGN